jgi:putative endonuclease
MYFVYVLSSENRSYIYIGITDNIERRFHQHQSGHNRTTKPYRPFRLILTEEYADRQQARIREKYLKTSYGRLILKKLKEKIS